MDRIENTLNSIKASLHERVSNPLLSSFVISWMIWNYKLILVLFSSSMTAKDKIEYISCTLYPFIWNDLLSVANVVTLLHFFVGPILTALVYIYVIYPKFGKRIYSDHKRHISEYVDIKNEIEGKTSMSEAEVVSIKSELRTIKGVHSKQLDEKDNNIKLLQVDVEKLSSDLAGVRSEFTSLIRARDELEAGIARYKKDNEALTELVTSLENEIAQLLSRSDVISDEAFGDVDGDEVSKVSGERVSEPAEYILDVVSRNFRWFALDELRGDMHRLKFNTILESLVAKDLVEVGKSQSGDTLVRITKKGEEYLIANKLIK